MIILADLQSLAVIKNPVLHQLFFFSVGTERHCQCETQVVFELQI